MLRRAFRGFSARPLVAPFNSNSKVTAIQIEVFRPALLAEKLNAFKAAGPTRLHLISDFDATLTVSSHNGQQAATTFSIISEVAYTQLNPQFKNKTTKLARVFYEKHSDVNLSQQEKSDILNEWWVKTLSLCIEEEIYMYNFPVSSI